MEAEGEMAPGATDLKAARADFITAHLLRTKPPAYSLDVAEGSIDRRKKVARVKVIEGDILRRSRGCYGCERRRSLDMS